MAFPLESPAPQLSLVPARQPKPRNYRRFLIIKRWMDILIASFLLIVFAPIMLIIALIIKLRSPGPVLVRLYRVGSRVRGKGGRPSWEMRAVPLYRFRTTPIDETAEQVLKGEVSANEHLNGKPSLTLNNASRFAQPKGMHFGYFLRRTGLDNLPQVFNILKGQISLVGPLPVSPEEVEGYGERELRRFEVQAGISGWWQVTCNQRGPKARATMIERDIWYVEHQSLKRDIRIMLITPAAILMRFLFS